MKFRKVIIALIVLSFIATLFAEEKEAAQTTHVNGAGSYGAVTLDSLNTVGLVKLNRTTVSQNLNVLGSLIANGAEIGSLDVTGEANLTDTRILKEGTVLGSFQARNSTFQKPLIINGQKATFTASSLNSITVRRMDAFKGKQIIELRQKSVVDGPIVFESGKGEVHLYSASKVLGPVSGGKIIKKY